MSYSSSAVAILVVFSLASSLPAQPDSKIPQFFGQQPPLREGGAQLVRPQSSPKRDTDSTRSHDEQPKHHGGSAREHHLLGSGPSQPCGRPDCPDCQAKTPTWLPTRFRSARPWPPGRPVSHASAVENAEHRPQRRAGSAWPANIERAQHIESRPRLVGPELSGDAGAVGSAKQHFDRTLGALDYPEEIAPRLGVGNRANEEETPAEAQASFHRQTAHRNARHSRGCNKPGCLGCQRSHDWTTPGEIPGVMPLDPDALDPGAPDLGDLTAPSSTPASFASPAGASRASTGAVNLVGDFFLGGGQFKITPPTIFTSQPVFSPPILDLRSDTVGPGAMDFILPGDPDTSFNVPGGIVPGVAGVFDQFPVVGNGLNTMGQTGTAFLAGIDGMTGEYVADVQLDPTLVPIAIPQPMLFFDIPAAGGSRRTKVSENNSPFPVCRVFFNYNFFENALQTSGPQGSRRGIDVSRYTFGVEKAFMCNLWSIEVRMPVGNTLDADQVVFGTRDATHSQLGNINLTLKAALLYGDNFVLAGGLGINLPTADDVNLYYLNTDTKLATVQNESLHLQPFLALLLNPGGGRFFMQGWCSVDFDTSGSDVVVRDNAPLQIMSQTANLRDQSILFLDGALGYSVVRTDGCNLVGLTAVTPAVEIHSNNSLQSADLLVQNNLVIGNVFNRFDVANLTLATHFDILGGQGTITPSYVMPLSGNDNRFFDGEWVAQCNLRY